MSCNLVFNFNFSKVPVEERKQDAGWEGNRHVRGCQDSFPEKNFPVAVAAEAAFAVFVAAAAATTPAASPLLWLSFLAQPGQAKIIRNNKIAKKKIYMN